MPAFVDTMAYFGRKPWHGLGEVLSEADCYNWEIACEKAGLNWEVEKVALQTVDTQTKVDRFAVRRTDNGVILGTVGARFELLQNQKAFEWFQPFLDTKEASLNTAGSLKEGSRVWVLAKLNRDPMVIARNDEVEKFILLSHGHDGSLAVRVGFTPIRVVCSNTLAMSIRHEGSKLLRIRHTKELQTNLENIREVMNLANEQFEATAEQYRLLAHRSINGSDLRKYVKKVLGIEEQDKLSTRSENIVEEVVRLAEVGRGNELASVRGTYWTAYNGVSEYLSYNRGNSPDKRMNSLWYGPGADMNKKALEVALTMSA